MQTLDNALDPTDLKQENGPDASLDFVQKRNLGQTLELTMIPNHGERDDHTPSPLDIQALGAEFAKSNRKDDGPRIEDFLARVAGANKSALFGHLLRIELANLVDKHHQPGPNEYIARFPEYASIIAATFADITRDMRTSATGNFEPDSVIESLFIGPYRILDTLGEGGMGVVYLAEQKEPIRRRVALKVIKLGMDTRDVLARFDAERQALAMMDHPNIARIYDAGITESGKPYFVMEHVPGVPITDYCDRHCLSVPERLGLFLGPSRFSVGRKIPLKGGAVG